MPVEFTRNPRLSADVARSPKLAAVLSLVALRVVREARKRAPVDTGRLRNSIGMHMAREGDHVVATIGTNVDYAAPQEFGTRTGVPPRRYLGGALQSVADTLRARGRR